MRRKEESLEMKGYEKMRMCTVGGAGKGEEKKH